MLPGVLLCSLLLLLTACSTSPTGNSGSATPTTTPGASAGLTPTSNTTSQPTVTTVAMPHTDVTCPAAGTARAAVMRPLALGSHQNLVYVYNEVPQNTTIAFGHLRRYTRSSLGGALRSS